MDNLKEFKELIKRYESITIEEIDKYNFYAKGGSVARKITGFGSLSECTLCDSASGGCDGCYWVIATSEVCNWHMNRETYDHIDHSLDGKSLLKAFKARAKYMKSILK